jgi:glucose-6-phosphate isomerase
LQHLYQFSETIKNLKPHVDQLKNFDHIIILGTGGSSLGGQALTALKNMKTEANEKSPNLYFIDNIDSQTFKNILNILESGKTGVVAISKSGNTAETLMQTLTLLQQWCGAGSDFDPKAQMRIITEPKQSGLSEIANVYGISCIEHPLDIGGRFSIFTSVGVLPGLLLGLDMDAFCKGALEVYNTAFSSENEEQCAPLLSALEHANYTREGINQIVLFVYADALCKYAEWFCQLWGESLGKKDRFGLSHGSTPIKAVGTTDQHSQLQLYLEGPRNKHFVVLVSANQSAIDPITLEIANTDPHGLIKLAHPSLLALDQRSLGDLMIAEQKATIDTLKSKGRPTRVIELSKIDEANLGALMMHSMLEVLALAKIWDVDPFDQPAVEDGKKRAIEYLKSQ